MTRRVLIVSDSSHKALHDEQRLLDRFLHRISDAVWAGLLSAEAEEYLRQTLLKTRSPYRAVLCIDASSLRPRWHVGRKRRLLPDGRQAISDRTQDIPQDPWPEPVVRSRALTALAALLHDFGKATSLFQAKLRPALKPKKTSGKTPTSPLSEPFRHHFLSTAALLRISSHETLQNPTLLKEILRDVAKEMLSQRDQDLATAARALSQAWNAPPITPILQAARVVAAHHGPLSLAIDDIHLLPTPFRAPAPRNAAPGPPDTADDGAGSPWADTADANQWRHWAAAMFRRLQGSDAPIPAGLDLFASAALITADRLSSTRPNERIADLDDPKAVLAKSSIPGRPGERKGQTLVGHLLQVAELATAFHDLAAGRRRLGIPPDSLPPSLTDLPEDGPFAWQGQALDAARRHLRHDRPAFLMITAGTGSGKTRVGPAILAVARSLVRITALLPLRSLTTQTRIAYRRLGLADSHVAIRIGGAPIPNPLDEDIPPPPTDTPDAPSLYDAPPDAPAFLQDQIDRLPSSLAKHLSAPADGLDDAARIVAVPILVATIDLMMGVPAGDSLHVLTAPLRLADTDLLLDEIDLLSPEDQACVHRLVRACAAYGGRVCLVSATLPPETATSLAAAYADGVRIRHALGLLPDSSLDLLVANDAFPTWHARIDAADATPQPIPSSDHPLHGLHGILQKQIRERTADPRRQVASLRISKTPDIPRIASTIRTALPGLLQSHHTLLPCGRRLSVGFVRLGTIERALLTAQVLSQDDRIPNAPQARLRILAYHANLSVQARAEIERLLDHGLLRRPDLPPPIAQDPWIRKALDQTPKDGTLVLLVVCTSILETGRDHDYDWGILEPESFRSLVQAAGRIRRHRHDPLRPDSPPNLLVFTYPLGDRPYAFPGPLTPHPLLQSSQAAQKHLESLDAHQALNLPHTTAPLDAARAAASPLAEAERDLRLAFLDRRQAPDILFHPIDAHLPIQQHLHAGRHDPTAWLAHGPKARRFRRQPKGTLDVEIWHDTTSGTWHARLPQRPQDTISLRHTPLVPGHALLFPHTSTDALLPTKELPLQASCPDHKDNRSLVSVTIEGHPWLGWRIC